MVEINNILWAYDGSKESEEALRWAEAFSTAFGAKILGVYISIIPETPLYEQPGITKDDLLKLIVGAETRHKSGLKSWGEKLSQEGIEFEGEVLRGKPSEAIVKCAEAKNANLIVMGNKGMGILDRLLIGSTTLATLRSSHIPVLTVKKQAEERPPGPPAQMGKILVPMDIGEDVNDALEYGLDLAEIFGAGIVALHVLRLETYAYEIPPHLLDNLLSAAERELNRRVNQLRDERGSRVSAECVAVPAISPALTIADYATRNAVDLIVINTHRRGGIKRVILGSVTEKVVQESKVPVLALKPE